MRAVALGHVVALMGACAPADRPMPTIEALPDPAAILRVEDSQGGRPEVKLDKRAILGAGSIELISGYDPYYKTFKRFYAVPLAPVLARAFPGVSLTTENLLLRCKDGYAVPIEGGRLLDGTAYLALADADRLPTGSQWEPIGPRRMDPSPFYLVWKGSDRADLERFPRPYALERIERARIEAVYPHVAPVGVAPASPAQRGYAIFKRECLLCHAMNREGGRVGPELNVPQSIVEYRPVAQVRAYIRDPFTFRYGAMPAHPHLTDADLDALIAYFSHMREHKFDPERSAAP